MSWKMSEEKSADGCLLPCSITPHPAPAQGRREPFLLYRRVEQTNKQTNIHINKYKAFSSGSSFAEARGGGWKAHSSLRQKGRRPVSILAGRALYFRRLTAS